MVEAEMEREIKLLVGNIFEYEANAMVCPVNREPILFKEQADKPLPLEGQLHKLAGPMLYEDRARRSYVDCGEAFVTNSHGLKKSYDFIIHAVSPRWPKRDTEKVLSANLLEKCYTSIFEEARSKLTIKTIITPLLSTGAMGCPVQLSYYYLKQSYSKVCMEHPDWDCKIIVCLKDNGDLLALSKFYEYLPECCVEGDVVDIHIIETKLKEYKMYDKYRKKGITFEDEVEKAYRAWLYLAKIEEARTGKKICSNPFNYRQLDLKEFIESKFMSGNNIKSFNELGKALNYSSSGGIYKALEKIPSKPESYRDILEAIAKKLHLDNAERTVLFELAGLAEDE